MFGRIFGGGSQGAVGSSSRFLRGVEFFETSVVGGAYAASGVRYLPIGSGDYFAWQFVAGKAGDASFEVHYAMSADNGGTLVLDVEAVPVAGDESVNPSPTAQAQVSVTPGSGTAKKTLTVAVAGLAEGDLVRVKVTRNASSTHSGDMRLLGVAD